MTLKSLVPRTLKAFLNKIVWFTTNFRLIDKSSNIRKDAHFHGPITYETDGLTTSNNCDFIRDPRFVRAYQAAASTNPWPGFTLQWRIHVICWFAELVKNIDGDFVECGVNTGAYSRAIIEFIDFNSLGKKFYLLDTFDGFPESQVTEAERLAGITSYGGDHYKNVYEQVVQTFAPYNVEIIKGKVPETLPQCQAKEIAFLSIDMNAVAPEIAAAEYFWPRIVKGGVIVLDDYGFPMHINQKLAFDEFASRKGVSILSLPTGQAIIIKP